MDAQYVRVVTICQSHKPSIQEVSTTMAFRHGFIETCLTGLVVMIIVKSISAILLAITMAAITMETSATVEKVVVAAADYLIGGTKTTLTLQT